MNAIQILYGACIVLTGLLAGLFYGYQCSVIQGLGRLSDKEYLSAFQSINKAILNPVFFLSFMGSLIVLIVTSLLSYKAGNTTITPFLIASTIVYAVGVFGITAACNVPLNDVLASYDIATATSSRLYDMRSHFEQSWNKWHLIRTVAAVLSFILLIIPLLKKI
ncbi:MAG: DUF1772 domain-containing protein [Bacteroidetes bacterium]|nr:MAG: DUF1772 domain-containing protein [Bacteroidota bacterium]